MKGPTIIIPGDNQTEAELEAERTKHVAAMGEDAALKDSAQTVEWAEAEAERTRAAHEAAEAARAS